MSRVKPKHSLNLKVISPYRQVSSSCSCSRPSMSFSWIISGARKAFKLRIMLMSTIISRTCNRLGFWNPIRLVHKQPIETVIWWSLRTLISLGTRSRHIWAECPSRSISRSQRPYSSEMVASSAGTTQMIWVWYAFIILWSVIGIDSLKAK